MHKVNWAANKSFEFIQNYKVLQTCFAKLSIEKVYYISYISSLILSYTSLFLC